MSKYITRSIIGLAIIAIGGHYYYWDKASREIERFIHDSIEQHKADAPHMNIDANYTLKRTGYPLTATVETSDYEVYASMNEHPEFQSKITGNITMWADITAPTTINILMTDTVVETTSNNNEQTGSATIKIETIKGKASPLNSAHHTYDLSVEDTDVYVSTPEVEKQRIFTVNNMKFVGDDSVSEKQMENVVELRDATQSFTAEGLTLLNAETKESMKVDLISFTSVIENLPATHPAIIEGQKISSLPMGSEASAVVLKKELVNLLDVMHKAKSRITTKDFRIKVDANLDIEVNTDITIDANSQPELLLEAKLMSGKPISEVLPAMNIIAIPLMMAQSTDEAGKVTYTVSIKDNILTLGNTPMMEIPSIINDIIPQIPDTFIVE